MTTMIIHETGTRLVYYKQYNVSTNEQTAVHHPRRTYWITWQENPIQTGGHASLTGRYDCDCTNSPSMIQIVLQQQQQQKQRAAKAFFM